MWMDSCLILPSGYFLLEPWDLKKFTHSAHLGVTMTVRDPNHEVLHSQERYITEPGPHKHVYEVTLTHVLAGFPIQIKAKQGWNVFNSVTNTTGFDWWLKTDSVSLYFCYCMTLLFSFRSGGPNMKKNPSDFHFKFIFFFYIFAMPKIWMDVYDLLAVLYSFLYTMMHYFLFLGTLTSKNNQQK